MSSVLVVDDNVEIRELVSLFLRRAGHSVTCAASGEEALERLRAGSADVAVLDVAMPGMTGLELLTRLREHSGHEELPAVFVSARTRPEDVARGTALGAKYLTKPFVGKQLISVVDGLLSP